MDYESIQEMLKGCQGETAEKSGWDCLETRFTSVMTQFKAVNVTQNKTTEFKQYYKVF